MAFLRYNQPKTNYLKYVLCSFDMCIGEIVTIVKKMNTFISPRCFLLYLDNPYLPSICLCIPFTGKKVPLSLQISLSLLEFYFKSTYILTFIWILPA